MRNTEPVRLLIVMTVLWLGGVAALGANYVSVGLVLTIPGLAALGQCFRQAVKGRRDRIAPWICCALVPLAFLSIFALSNVHLHEFTGSGPGCDALTHSCGIQPLLGLLHASSLVAFILVGASALRLIAGANRAAIQSKITRIH